METLEQGCCLPWLPQTFSRLFLFLLRASGAALMSPPPSPTAEYLPLLELMCSSLYFYLPPSLWAAGQHRQGAAASRGLTGSLRCCSKVGSGSVTIQGELQRGWTKKQASIRSGSKGSCCCCCCRLRRARGCSRGGLPRALIKTQSQLPVSV